MSSGKVEDTKEERTRVVVMSWWGTARFGTSIANTSQMTALVPASTLSTSVYL